MMSWWKKPWVLPVLLAAAIVAGSNWYIKQILQHEAVPQEEVKARLESMYQGTVEKMTEGLDVYEAEIRRDGALYGATVDHKTGKVLALTLLEEGKPAVAMTPVTKEAESAGDAPASGQPEEEPAEQLKSEQTAAAEPAVKAPEKPAEQPAPVQKNKPQTQAETQPAPQPKPQVKPQPKPQPAPAPKPAAPKKSALLTSQQAADIAVRKLNAKVPVKVDDIDFVATQQGGYYLVELDLDTDADRDEVVYQIHAISGSVMSVTWDD